VNENAVTRKWMLQPPRPCDNGALPVQAGQTLAVRVRGTRADGSAHAYGAVAQFYAPGRDPRHVPADREPDRQAVLAFDPGTRLYGAEVRTDGWQPGDWTLRGVVLGASGAPEGWAWYSFPLEA
jgi:hypothetical protein